MGVSASSASTLAILRSYTYPEAESTAQDLFHLGYSGAEAHVLHSIFVRLACGGEYLNAHDFFRGARIPRSPIYERVFLALDIDGSGAITFRDFCISLWSFLSLDEGSRVRFALYMLDPEGVGGVGLPALAELLVAAYGEGWPKKPLTAAIFVKAEALIELRTDRLLPPHFLTFEEFATLTRGHASMLLPIAYLSIELRKAFGGERFWARIARKRRVTGHNRHWSAFDVLQARSETARVDEAMLGGGDEAVAVLSKRQPHSSASSLSVPVPVPVPVPAPAPHDSGSSMSHSALSSLLSHSMGDPGGPATHDSTPTPNPTPASTRPTIKFSAAQAGSFAALRGMPAAANDDDVGPSLAFSIVLEEKENDEDDTDAPLPPPPKPLRLRAWKQSRPPLRPPSPRCRFGRRANIGAVTSAGALLRLRPLPLPLGPPPPRCRFGRTAYLSPFASANALL